MRVSLAQAENRSLLDVPIAALGGDEDPAVTSLHLKDSVFKGNFAFTLNRFVSDAWSQWPAICGFNAEKEQQSKQKIQSGVRARPFLLELILHWSLCVIHS